MRVLTTLLLCATAQAATLTVNISCTASGPVSSLTSFTGTGSATLSGGITDTGTISATVSLGTSGFSGPYTLTLKNGTMGGTLTVPATVLTGSGAGTMTVTNAGGSYAGYSGTFNITGTGSVSTSITLSFTGSGTITTGGTVTAPPPTITAVLDAGSYTSTLAPGSIFVVKGSNLSASGLTSLNFPLPTSSPASSGTTINFAPLTGGSGTPAYLIYTYLENGINQLAAVLPSTIAPGNYNVTVTYAGVTSSPMQVQVVANKFEIITRDSTGNGMAAAEVLPSYNIVQLTTGTFGGSPIQPAHPGDVVVVYGTGLGPITGFADNIAVTAAYAFNNVSVILGGTSITPAYAGRSVGAAGLDEVAFTIPSNFSATGCAVTLQVMQGNTTSAATTLPVAASSSATACTYPNLTTAQLQGLDQGGTLNGGAFSLTSTTTSAAGQKITEATIAGGFAQLTGFELSSVTTGSVAPPAGQYNITTIGSCTVITSTSTGSSTTVATVTAGGYGMDLDAGAVTLNGPSGSNLTNVALNETTCGAGASGCAPNVYSATLAGPAIPGSTTPNGTIVAGTYSLAGKGGKDVNSFSTSINLSPLTITGGLPSTVTESAGLPIAWSGGNSSDAVVIEGFTLLTSGTGASATSTVGEFVCTTTAGAGGFNVPSTVLTLLPKSSNGFLDVVLQPSQASFSPGLTAGGSIASVFTGSSSTGGTASYQ